MKNSIVRISFPAAMAVLLVACSPAKRIQNFRQELTPQTLEYGPENCYSRAITGHENYLYIAASDGYAYAYDLKKRVARNLNMLPYVELRDIHVFDSKQVIASQAADTSVVLSIRNDLEQTEQLQAGPAFWDALDFNQNGFGLVVGDPIDGRFTVYVSSDKGLHWNKVNSGLEAVAGEAAFAASGSIAQVLNDSSYLFVSGGAASKLYRTSNYGKSWTSFPIPFQSGEGSGAFSVYFLNDSDGIVVGGNYLKAENPENTCFITSDGGKSWTKATKPPRGYRSHVINAYGVLYACGTNGLDVSLDFGLNWYPLNDTNSFAMTLFQDYIYVTTTKGKVYFFKAFRK